MSNTKTGPKVRNSADLQGLVTSTILRQSIPFSAEDIIVLVNKNLSGSTYQSSLEVEDCVRRTISLFCIEDILKYLGDKEYVVSAAFPAI